MNHLNITIVLLLAFVNNLNGQGQSEERSLEEIASIAYEFAQSDIDSCFFYAGYIESQAAKSKDIYWQEKAQYYLGVCYSVNGQQKEAKEALQSFLKYAISINNVDDISHTRYELAQGINNNEDLSSALELLNEAIEGFKSMNNQKMVAKALVTKCVIQRRQRQYDVASATGEEALSIYQSINDSTGIADVYNAFGMIKAFQGDMKGAADYFDMQSVINERINDLFGLGHSLGNSGLAYLRMNDIENGERNIKKAVEIRKKIGMPYELGMSLIQLAEVYVIKKDYNTALLHSKEALSIAQTHDNKLIKESAYKQLSFIEEESGRMKQALSYYKKYEKVKDSLLNDKISENVQEVEAVYQTAEKEKQIQELEFEDQLNQSRISQQRLALGGATVGLGLLSFLLYRIFGQKKQIEEQNGIISKALSEKDTLLREIHHRVKNNLQVISSLLRIQSNETTDEVAIDALKEGQSRVQSMSLIHQDLYQHDNLTGIKMEDYLERLTRNLFDTYNISHDRIKLNTDIEDIQLDVDTVVPLGLIINELVSNSLKYAFPNEQNGIINVALKEKGDNLILLVQDNGIGIPEESKDESFGYGLIQAFANKLEANMTVDGSNGTRVKLIITEYQKVC